MKPHDFSAYKDKYETISLERTDDGILTMTIHELDNPAGPVKYDVDYDWKHPHVEWSHCFNDIARDYENEVVIITNAGDDFITEDRAPYASDAGMVGKEEPIPATAWDWVQHNGKALQMNLLNIEVPVIGAIRGQATVHAELATQSDIVICSEDTVLQDLPHFESGGYAPGDGVGLHWPAVLGPNRGRYFLLTGQRLDAQQALELGVVQEVLPKDRVLERAGELARDIMRRPKLIRRYTRIATTQIAKKQMLDHLGFGMALEGLSVAGRPVPDGS
jgi:enoyl-CoA hydratase/carnithine racemase